MWDTNWSDKEQRLARLTGEEAEYLHGRKEFQGNESEEFKKLVNERAEEYKEEHEPSRIGESTTGGSPPHRKTPGGLTRALRVMYAPWLEKTRVTALAHIEFFLDRAVELGLRLQIATTEAGQKELCASEKFNEKLKDAYEAEVVMWDILPQNDLPSRWAEDTAEYLESGMRVETRHFARGLLESAMKAGRQGRGVWGGQGVKPEEMYDPEKKGVPLGMLVNDPALRGSKAGEELRKRIRAYIEGGNMISGEDAEGNPVILVGRDAIHATANLYNITPDEVRDVLAEDFFGKQDQRDRIVPVEQPGTFHLDMGILFVGHGAVIVNDSSAALNEQEKAKPIIQTIIALENEAVKDLKEARLTVVRQHLSGLSHNFFNGEFVQGKDERFYYLTNGGTKEQQDEFKNFLSGHGVADVFFTPAEVAKSTLAEQGGVGCRAKGIPDSALTPMVDKVKSAS